MNLFLIIIFMICIYKLKIKYNQGYFNDYMSIEKTTSIKGIFILFVFYRHILNYASFNNSVDLYFNIINKLLSQLLVTMFLFYSGYGIFESIKKKKQEYIDRIPINRILRVLIEFDIAIIIFLAINILKGNKYTLKKIVLTFIGWDSIGNSNWYIFCILATYTFTYLSFKIFKKSNIKAIIGVTILSLFFIGIMSKYKQGYWYNTVLCYAYGMWFSYFKEKLEKFILESNGIYLFYLLSIIGFFVFIRKYVSRNILVYEMWCLLFVSIIVLISMKVSINNSVLFWLGDNLFGLYILQRIPMIVFKDLGLLSYNKYIYFVVSLLFTGILATIFKKCISDNISKCLKRIN